MIKISGQIRARSQKNVPARFVRHDHFPPGWEESAAQFVSLIHRYGYIYKPLNGETWFSADPQWKLTDSEILKAIACSHKYILGYRSGKTARFAVLDIDQGSQYHTQQSLDKLLELLSSAGLSRSSLFRSSYSGGWHLYIFFDEPLNSAELRGNLVKLLTLSDYKVAKGQLEIFPHPGEHGSSGLGLRLPMQPGFAWLDKRSLDIDYERHELTATKALELFVDALEADANPYAAFKQLKAFVQDLEQRRLAATSHGVGILSDNVIVMKRAHQITASGEHLEFVRGVFSKLPPGIIVDNWFKGRLYHLNGLTGPSQRADSIECLGHYFFYGDPSRDLPALGYGYEKEREWAMREFLLARHQGQSKDINRGRADAIQQVERAANWRPAHVRSQDCKKYRQGQPIAWIRANENRKNGARKRIIEATDRLKNLGRSFSGRDVQAEAQCSFETLQKHKDIWQKHYEDIAGDFFETATGEYNVVVGAGSSQTEPPSTCLKPDMPLERLAARQIASELSMRTKRETDRSRKAVLQSKEHAEKDWEAKVTALLKVASSEPNFQKLKALIVVLVSYLSMAPTEEQQKRLQTELTLLKIESSNCRPHLVFEAERPPPPT